MKNSKGYINSWVNKTAINPAIAACLILGLNPDQTVYYSNVFNQYNTDNGGVADICRVLNGTDFRTFQRTQNIFHYVDIALENMLSPCKELMKRMRAVYDNYLPPEQISFQKIYPYIARELELVQPGQEKSHDKPSVAVNERNAIWHNLLKQIEDRSRKNGKKITIKTAASMIRAFLIKNNHSEYLVNNKRVNELVSVATIERTLADYHPGEYDKTIKPLEYFE